MLRKTAVKIPQPLIHVTKKQENNEYLPMLNGKASKSIATMIGLEVEKDAFNGNGSIITDDAKLVIEKFSQLKGTLGVGAHKLLCTAIAFFTHINHTAQASRKINETEVSIPLKSYAYQCGYNIIEAETSTKEEAEKEAKRAENALKDARKKINKDLAILFASSLSWKETVKGKEGNFFDVRLIEKKGIENGNIVIRFSQSFSEYLIKLPITQYSLCLLGVDERNENAYLIGIKMAEHYNMDTNQITGNASRLKVKTLLAVTNLPNIDSSSVKKNSWKSRIKEPFEKALDVLTQIEFLEDWEYCHPNGVPLIDEEANFSTFKEWSEILIKFTLKNAPDHTTRLKNKLEQKNR